MVDHLVVALKLLGNALQKPGVGVQAGDLVFVLVGHELEQIARHRLGQRRGALRQHAVDKCAVSGGVSGVLVVGQKGFALGDHVFQGRAFFELHDLRRLHGCQHGRQIVGAAAAPFKRGQVVGHGHVVELDGAVQ